MLIIELGVADLCYAYIPWANIVESYDFIMMLGVYDIMLCIHTVILWSGIIVYCDF